MTDASATVSEEQVQLLLRQAMDHIGRKNIPTAESLLSQVLAQSPEDHGALQLLGVIRRMQGLNAEAEDLYRRSLAVNPDQPQVHHNLGNLLKTLGRFDEAAAEQREAIRLKPNYAEAHLNLGLALSMMNDHTQAENSFRDALRLQPNYMFAKQGLATALYEQGRTKETETLLRQSLSIGSRDPRQVAALEHNLAMALKTQRRFDEALPLFNSAQAKVPDMPAVDYNRGNTLQQLGRLEEAAACYQRAVARNPLDLLAHRDLNQLLYRLADDENMLRSYDDAAALYPDQGALPLAKGNFLYLRGQYDDALECFGRAARLLPDKVTPHNGLGLVLAEKGAFDEAVREHEIAVRMDPEAAFVWRNYAQTLVRAGDGRAALAAAERALVIEPQDQGSLAIWGLALRLVGDEREEYINDVASLVRVYEIEPPAGYDDIGDFNRDLNAYLDGLHRDKRECIDQTLRRGTQTLNDLFGVGHAPAELLRARIDEAVTDYIARMPDDATHPLLVRKRAAFDYAGSWSSRLHDCGFHTNHIHPKGWISSAYYVALPAAVENEETQEGWIKFGEPNFACGLKTPVRRTVQPRVGTLVLFPSYMWHGTVPFHSQQSRTTVAFDVVPRL